MNIDFPVTRTKILIPRRRAELLSRPRLLDTLYDLLDARLVLIAAPAGYGKTSLLIDFIHQSELPFCWYALDPLDKDPQRFIAHLISSINLRFPAFGQSSAQAFNNSSQDRLNLDALVTAIVNDAYENIREHFVIVLDDYHLVRESKQVDHFVSRFVQDMDENCHVVIASRTLLTLPDLPLMVARSQVGGLSFEELAFNPNEIQTLLAKNYNQVIKDETAIELARQSEGWITGLLMSTQMIGKDAAGRLRSTRATGVSLYDYLAEQVLQQQTPELQDFLLRSSLLEEFNADFCDEVIGKALALTGVKWDQLIDDLFRNNLFVLPVGEEQIWLRYHHLFRDFMSERIQRERPEESGRILLRLAEVYAGQGSYEQAFAIFNRLNRPVEIADLTERAGPSLVVRGRLVTLGEWLNVIPAEIRDVRPALLSLQGTVTVMRGDSRQGLALFNQAIETLRQSGSDIQLAQALERRSTTARMLGDYQSALADAKEALALSQKILDMPIIEAEALRCIGNALDGEGKLVEALTWLGRSLTVYQAANDEQNTAKLSLEIGRVNETLGNYQDAQKAYYRALDIWQAGGNTIWQANLLNNLGVLQHLSGDYETAASTLEKAVQLSREGSYPRMEAFSLTSIGDLYRDLEAASEALDAYRWARLIARQIMDHFLLMYLDLAEAGMARIQGQYYQSSELLAGAWRMAEESQSAYEKYLCQLESGCLRVARKEYSAALSDLEEAAEFFSGEGYRVEAIRTHLYLVVAHAMTGNLPRAKEYCNRLSSFVSGTDNHPLVVSGREVRLALENIGADPLFNPLVGDLIEQIREFEERIPQIRRNLRRRAIAVPFAPAKIVIRTLGRMQVRINDHLISSAEWQTQSCRDLFFLILAHPEGLTKEDIGAIFWPDASPGELKLRFKNNVYRVRHAVGKDNVYLQDDYYYFNRLTDYEYDAESFQREIMQAEETTGLSQKLDHYQAGLRHYRGTYLPEIQETWVVAERERLHRIYMESLLKVAEIYRALKQYDNALTYCKRALKEDTCLEAAHRLAMMIHNDLGNRAALARQYEDCRKALLEEIDAEPSPQTQELYEMLMRQN